MLLQTLQQFYPLEDRQKLAQVAMFTVKEQVKLGPVSSAFISKEHTHIELRLTEPSTILMPGRQQKQLQLIAPLRLEACQNLDEVMKCITIFAIVTAPVVQALLHLKGYRLSIGLGKKEERKTTTEDPKKDE